MKALILIDLQNDFMPGGALAVPQADEVIPVIHQVMPHFEHVVATQDWHPPHHVSFASTHGKRVGERIQIEGQEQLLWPDHCIQNTLGADLVKGLNREKIEAIFHKGADPHIDSYSAFFDNARQRQTGLAVYLQKQGVKVLFFAGVATEYCVLYSVLDALKFGFSVSVIWDACRAIDPHRGDVALQQMQKRGASLIDSSAIERSF